MKARLKESYDAMADVYAARFTEHDPSVSVRIKYIRQMIQQLDQDGVSSARVLELGCGNGVPATQFLLENEKPRFSVTGNDLSSAQITLARANLARFKHRIQLMEGDMLALTFPEASWDVVTAFYSVFHLPRREQTLLVKNIYSWLRPGGFLLSNFAGEEVEQEQMDKWLGHEKGWMFWSGWGKDGSLKMMQESGFEVVIGELLEDVGDATFLWVLARKPL
ncbi:hypothetical protein ACEQ8H_003235 [Pleosporales sp. CAS-2024a]